MSTRHAALLALITTLAPLTQVFATEAGKDSHPPVTPTEARVRLVENDAVIALPDGTRVQWRRSTSLTKSSEPWGSPFHCPAEASCPGPSLESAPQQATTTDDALGSYLYLGTAGTIIARFVDPNGSNRHNNVFSWNLAPCPEGTYNLTPLLSGYTWCFPPGQLDIWNFYPHGSPGIWNWRLLADGVVVKEVPFEMLPAKVEKLDGDGQQGVVNERLESPLVVQLLDKDGVPVNFPKNDRSQAFRFSISGPGGSTGAYVSAIGTAYPTEDGIVQLNVVLGSKKGAYTVKVEHPDAGTPGVEFRLTAVEHDDPEDDEENEEDVGDEDPCDERVGNPISLKIGNKVQREVDYARAGLSPLEFVRTYNSFGSVSRITGTYWSTTFDRFLLLQAGVGNAVRLRRPDGLTIRFWREGAEWLSRKSFKGLLTETAQGWRYTDPEGTVEDFDAEGRLLSITDLQGRILSLQYDRRSGRLIRVSANTGEYLSFTYGGFGQLSKLTDHTARVWEYSYSGYANLTRLKRPDGVVHTYLYEQYGHARRLTGITIGSTGDPYYDERIATWRYDDKGRAVSSFAGRVEELDRVDIAFHEDGSRTVTGARGQVSEYIGDEIDGRWYLRRIDGPALGSCGVADLEREYDADGNTTAEVRLGIRTEYADFDAFGQARLRIEAAGSSAERRLEFEYDPRFIGRPTFIAEPSVAGGRRKTTEIDYDPRGNPTRIHIRGFRPDGTPVEQVRTFAYGGPFGQLTLQDGPRADGVGPVHYEYDGASQRLRRVTDANGIVQRDDIQYTATGQIASERRPNGVQIGYGYDPGSGRLTALTETHATGVRSTLWTYTPRGQVASIRHSGSGGGEQALNFAYAANGALIRVESADGARVEYELDAAGNVVQERTFQGAQLRRWLQRSFDAYDHIEQLIQDGSAQAWSNHPRGTPRQMTDGRGQVTEYEYDDLLRLTSVLQPGSAETHFSYDASGLLSGVTDANGGGTTYEHDDLDNVLSLSSPDTGVSVRSYDSLGQMTVSTDAMGQTTAYAYDAGGRLRSIDRPGTEHDATYDYDGCSNGVGLLCGISMGNGEYVRYGYDGLGRIATVETPAGTFGYVHDGADRIVRLRYPSGREIAYPRNASGQVLEVRLVDGAHEALLARDVQHEPFGPVRGWVFGNGIAHTRQHDAQYWLRGMSHAGVLDIALPTYDGNGNLRQMDLDGRAQHFGYDAQDRLDTAEGDFGLRGYGLDAVGNRLALEADGSGVDYAYAGGSNRLLGESGWSYERDANGNRTARLSADGVSGLRYDHSPHDRLVALRERDGTLLASYRHNGLGQRTAKTVGASTTRFVHDLQGRLLAELDGSGTILREYVYLEGIPLAVLPPRAALPPPPSHSQTVDNRYASGDFVVQRDNKAVGGDYLRTAADRGTYIDSHDWSFSAPVAGDYRVEVWWMRPNNQTQGCTWYDFAGQRRCLSNASGSKGSWVTLGSYTLLPGTHRLRIEEDWYSSDGLYADAARITLESAAADDLLAGAIYLHTDHLGAPRAASDTAGTPIWRASYDPFGWATVEDDVDGDGVAFELNLRFPGQYLDAESGLHHNYFRDYDPALGRYIQSDPIGLAGGVNTYVYANTNPISYTDALGLVVEVCRDPAFNGMIPGQHHYWLRTDSQESGMGTPNAGVNAGNEYDPLGSRVETVDHTGRGDGPKAECRASTYANEAVVDELIRPGRDLGHFLPPVNYCRSFVLDALRESGGEFPFPPYLGPDRWNPAWKNW